MNRQHELKIKYAAKQVIWVHGPGTLTDICKAAENKRRELLNKPFDLETIAANCVLSEGVNRTV